MQLVKPLQAFMNLFRKNSLTALANAGYTEELKAQEARRYDRYRRFWRMYRGEHWLKDELDDASPTPVVNKIMVYVNKSIAFLVGRTPKINYLTTEIETLLAPHVFRILKASGNEKFYFDSVQMGSVTGDLILHPVYDESERKVKIVVMDSSDCALKYTFFRYQNEKPDKVSVEWQYLDSEGVVHTRREEWGRNFVEVYIDDEYQDNQSHWNAMGFIPFVHIRNMQIGKEVYGMSDVEQVEILNKLLNASIRRFRDDVEYNGDPITLMYGVRAKNVDKGVGNTWSNLPAPQKCRIEHLELKSDLPAQQKYIEYIDKALSVTSGIPEVSLTGEVSISNTSGVALHMLNLPIVELTDRKKLTYGPGFSSAIGLALQLQFLMDKKQALLKETYDKAWTEGNDELFQYVIRQGFDPSYVPTGIVEDVEKITKLLESSYRVEARASNWYDVQVQFLDYLPKDRLVELSEIREEMSLGIESRKGAMKRLGKDDIDATLEEVDAEVAKLLAIKALYGKASAGNTEGMRDKTETPEGASK